MLYIFNEIIYLWRLRALNCGLMRNGINEQFYIDAKLFIGGRMYEQA